METESPPQQTPQEDEQTVFLAIEQEKTIHETTPTRPFWRIIVFNLCITGNVMTNWFGMNVLFPLQVFFYILLTDNKVIEYIGNEHKSNLLAILSLIISIITVTSGPLAGWISDHIQTRIGRRIPVILLGGFFNALQIFRAFLPVEHTGFFILNVILVILSKMGFAITNTGFLSMVSDYFPEKQMGLVGGINSFTTLFSAGFGIALLGYLHPILGRIVLCSILSALCILNVTVHVILFREPSSGYSQGKMIQLHFTKDSTDTRNLCKKGLDFFIEFLTPLRYRDFNFLFLSRFVYLLGFENITAFAIYFLQDKVRDFTIIVWEDVASTPEQALAILMVCLLGTGLCSSLLFGFLADKFRRKKLMCFSGMFTMTGAIMVTLFPSFNVVLVAGIFLGIGIGGCDAVYLGLLLSIIEKNTPHQKAQNMALFNTVTQVMPKVLASAVGGAAIAIGTWLWKAGVVPIQQFGYNCLYATSAVLVLLGSLVILFISNKYQTFKKRKSLENISQ